MIDQAEWTSWLTSFLQADERPRQDRFPQFVEIVKAIATAEGSEVAWAWARRAVSPLLDYSSLLKLRRLIPAVKPGAAVVRLAILGGPTTVQLRQLIEVFLAAEGIACQIYEAEYGLFRQEILGPSHDLDAFAPQIVFIASGALGRLAMPGTSAGEAAVAELAEQEYADWARVWETANVALERNGPAE